MKDMPRSNSNAQTIIVDRGLAQLSASQAAYPEARVSFYLFHPIMDVRQRCASLPITVEGTGKRIHQWMRNFVFVNETRF